MIIITAYQPPTYLRRVPFHDALLLRKLRDFSSTIAARSNASPRCSTRPSFHTSPSRCRWVGSHFEYLAYATHFLPYFYLYMPPWSCPVSRTSIHPMQILAGRVVHSCFPRARTFHCGKSRTLGQQPRSVLPLGDDQPLASHALGVRGNSDHHHGCVARGFLTGIHYGWRGQ